MKKKTKKILGGVSVALIIGAVVGGTAYLTKGFKDFDIFKPTEKVVDDSRVAFTIYGTENGKWTSAYVFMNHPDLEDAYLPLGSWEGIMPKDKVGKEDYDYITYNGNNSYTIELTDLLPLEYDDFSKFLEDGGTCGLILSYATEDNLGRIQSSDILIEESGNHYYSMPTENNGQVSHNVVKFEKYAVVEDEEKEDTSKEETKEESTSEETQA